MRASLVGLATLASLVLGSGDVRAQQFDANQAESCVLGNGAKSALEQSLKNDTGLTGNLSVDVIVIHSVANPNEGQPIGGGDFTGPIVCTFRGTSGAILNSITVTDANRKIPDIDILGTEIVSAIQYRRNSNSLIEKLMCLTTDSSNRCFTIAPAAPGVQ